MILSALGRSSVCQVKVVGQDFTFRGIDLNPDAVALNGDAVFRPLPAEAVGGRAIKIKGNDAVVFHIFKFVKLLAGQFFYRLLGAGLRFSLGKGGEPVSLFGVIGL
jgi:hypothetical protein